MCLARPLQSETARLYLSLQKDRKEMKNASMTRVTDTERQAGRSRLRPPLSSQRLVADGEGTVTHIRNMK